MDTPPYHFYKTKEDKKFTAEVLIEDELRLFKLYNISIEPSGASTKIHGFEISVKNGSTTKYLLSTLYHNPKINSYFFIGKEPGANPISLPSGTKQIKITLLVEPDVEEFDARLNCWFFKFTEHDWIQFIKEDFFTQNEYKELFVAVQTNESWYLGQKVAGKIIQKLAIPELKQQEIRKTIADALADIYKDGFEYSLEEFIATIKNSVFLTLPVLKTL